MQDELHINLDDFKANFATDGEVNKERLTLLQQHRDDPSNKVRPAPPT